MSTTVTIKCLPAEIIARVSAEQVIERPLSVVKELLENSLDSGATRIVITLKDGGFSKITVLDNGSGMSPEDLLMSIERHATSKIATTQDLDFLKTLGFRGEGLWSIAQVSELELATCTASSLVGTKLCVSYGTAAAPEPVGTPQGTWVQVSQLFGQTPGRAGRQKSSASETKAVAQLCTHFAWLHPHVHFVLESQGKRVLDLLPVSNLVQRATQIWGESIVDHAVPVSLQTAWGTMKGLLLLPQEARTHTLQQYLGINGRPVKAPEITNLIRAQYTRYLAPERHPLWVLDFSLEPSWVDVNVHPRKELVSFHDLPALLAILGQTIQETLEKSDKTHQFGGSRRQHAFDEATQKFLDVKNTVPDFLESIDDDHILQVDNTYLVLSTRQGLLLVDQHAAHESQLYNQLKNAWSVKEKEGAICRYNSPLQVQLPPAEYVVLEAHKDTVASLGVELIFRDNGIIEVLSLPEVWSKWPIKQLLSDLAYSVENSFSGDKGLPWIHTTLAYLACRRAIKAGDRLTFEERKKLVRSVLEETDTYTCPHGRPSRILITPHHLARFFERV